MMDYDAQLKLQAYLDGELPEAEARAVATWLARDREAVALLAELRATRKALAGFEAGIRLPESGEFFWSKIQRAISTLELAEPAREPFSLFGAWRRFLVPAGTLAAVALATLVASVQFGLWSGSPGPDAESALADSGAFTYHDYSTRTTLVWFSYPAENEFAEGEPLGSVN